MWVKLGHETFALPRSITCSNPVGASLASLGGRARSTLRVSGASTEKVLAPVRRGPRYLSPRFENHVEVRLGRPAELRKAGFRRDPAQSTFACLGPEPKSDFLR
jgi:hypothetical protein